jgi:hypothetical protein
MKKNQSDRLIKLWFNFSVLIVLIGAIFKLQHYPNGQGIFIAGIASWFISLGVKSIIAKSRKENI